MAIDTTTLRTRRALLAGAGGALAALAAQALGRPLRAHAADPNDVVLGSTANTATTPTQITNTAAGNAFVAYSDSGRSIFGDNRRGFGVFGRAVSGNGVYGVSTSGLGLLGRSQTGYALQTDGRLDLGTSGVATIPAGATSRIVHPGVDVTSGSFVLLTPRIKLRGRDLWYATDPASDTFSIRMSSARTTQTRVAWLLLG